MAPSGYRRYRYRSEARDAWVVVPRDASRIFPAHSAVSKMLMSRIYLFIGAMLLALAPIVHAQTKLVAGSPEAKYAERLNRNIISMTGGENAESAIFNERINQMNAAQPLGPQNLDSAHVAANVALVMDFTTYLQHERTWSDSLYHSFMDSMYVLSEDRPADLKVLDAANIETSFDTERTAYNNFLGQMGKVYADVLDALLFLQHTHYVVKKNQPVFDTKADVKQYMQLMKAVDADSKALDEANKALREANAKANAITKEQEQAWTP